MPTAILIDGGYFVKRFRNIEPHNALNAERAAECAYRWAVAHLSPPRRPKPAGQQQQQQPVKPSAPSRDLYRIFFYDCPPLTNKLHNPITKRVVDFAKSDEAIFRQELHAHLRSKRKVALRLGHLSTNVQWTIKPEKITDLLKGKIKFEDLTDRDVIPNVRQKGVDMRIGVDVSSLAFKRQVDQIVLLAGDADFVPAAKQARREGIDFILDPMWSQISENLQEHIDGLRSTCPRPKDRKQAAGEFVPVPVPPGPAA